MTDDYNKLESFNVLLREKVIKLTEKRDGILPRPDYVFNYDDFEPSEDERIDESDFYTAQLQKENNELRRKSEKIEYEIKYLEDNIYKSKPLTTASNFDFGEIGVYGPSNSGVNFIGGNGITTYKNGSSAIIELDNETDVKVNTMKRELEEVKTEIESLKSKVNDRKPFWLRWFKK